MIGSALVALAWPAASAAQDAFSADATSDDSKPVQALGSDLNPFGSDINPFWGDLNPFGGDINPFGGDINPFWGDINPFYDDIPAPNALNPLGGDINPFWGTLNPARTGWRIGAPEWGAIGGYWRRAGDDWAGVNKLWNSNAVRKGDAKSLQELAAQLDAMVRGAETVWGATVTKRTGRDFTSGFANPLFAKYGIDRADWQSLARINGTRRNAFFLDWYDSLMAHSGADRVDWWMPMVNWSPSVTQQQGNGADTVIGLLDADARGDRDILNNIISFGGFNATVGGHGAGVASLMVAAHDGQGVMGIAPRARVVAYNPFDASYTASWSEVAIGIANLRARGASIINASLGAKGWTMAAEWANVFAARQAAEASAMSLSRTGTITSGMRIDSSVIARATAVVPGFSNPVYVLAAGNSGVTQKTNIHWDFASDPAFILVGSVDPYGQISSFSNRPGTTCLLKAGKCTGDYLMNHFIVAPGELILTSDGAGGVVRRTGTSFAAPLVSGAIALLHDRWPWLAQYPQESAGIILSTAKDLGEKGVDPVYGVGLLDVTRSQSPISFNNLVFFEVNQGVSTEVSAPQLLATGKKETWEADGVYFVLYEKVGDTFRDFQVPMSNKLVGWVRNWNGKREQFQRFIRGQFTDWLSGGNRGFTDVSQYGVTMSNGLRMSIAGSAPVVEAGRNQLSAHTALRIDAPEGRFGFTVGQGFGAMAIGAQPGFARSTDYAAGGGGSNPLLGLASGGAFMQGAVRLGGGTLSMGFTQNELTHADSALFSDVERHSLRGFDAYRASAVNLAWRQPVGQRLTVSLDYARVKEANALLGVQSTGRSDLRGGAMTDALTFGAAYRFDGGLTAAFTGTQGRTRSDRDQLLTTEGAVGTSAYAFSLEKRGIGARNDLLRVAVTQPLHIDGGQLSLAGVDVVDRASGTLGTTAQGFAIGGERRQYVGELLYAVPIAKGAGEIGLFGKGDLRAAQGTAPAYVVGGHINLKF